MKLFRFNKTIKEEFPLFKSQLNKGIHYLDNAATTQKPHSVIKAQSHFLEHNNANTHRGIYRLSERATEKVEHARATIARFMNATPEEIIFTKNATEGFNLLAYSLENTTSLPIKKTDNIVITEIEHHSNYVPWQQLAIRKKCQLKVVPYDKKTDTLADISKYVDKNTKIVAFTAMSNVSGIILPVQDIIKTIRKKNKDVIIIVDGTQYIAHHTVDVLALDCDFFVWSAHKMYGPTGVGIVFGKSFLLQKIAPFLFGGHMIKVVEKYESTFADVPDKFESGTLGTRINTLRTHATANHTGNKNTRTSRSFTHRTRIRTSY